MRLSASTAAGKGISAEMWRFPCRAALEVRENTRPSVAGIAVKSFWAASDGGEKGL